MNETTLGPITCPYCNAVMPPPTNPGLRLTCPRCGEAFPFKGDPGRASGAGRALAPLSPPPWTNKQVVRVLLGVMGSTALIALVYALLTVSVRRGNDVKTVSEPTPVTTVSPADLNGLRYLPERSNVIVGLHVADALRFPAGKEVLTQSAWLRTTGGRSRLEAMTGLALADIDHAVLGLRVSEATVPPAVLVVQTRRPIDEDQVKQALHVQDSKERGGRKLYPFKTETALISPVLWFADRYTLVVAAQERYLDDVPREPAGGAERFPAAVRDLIKERIDRGAQAWLAAHVPDLEKIVGPLLILLPQQEENKELLARLGTFSRVRAVDLSLNFRTGVALNAEFDCADDKTAQALEAFLAPPADGALLKALETRPEAAAIFQELAASLKRDRQGTRLTLNAQAAPETVQKALGTP